MRAIITIGIIESIMLKYLVNVNQESIHYISASYVYKVCIIIFFSFLTDFVESPRDETKIQMPTREKKASARRKEE